MNLSGFHQNEGQEVEQQAQRMHSYRPSSSGPVFRRLQPFLSGWRPVVDQIRFYLLVLTVELGHIYDQITNYRQAGQRPQNELAPFDHLRHGGDAGQTILPFMLMPSEPQTPSRQERR